MTPAAAMRARLRRPPRSIARLFFAIVVPAALVLQALLIATGFTEWQVSVAGVDPRAVSAQDVFLAFGLPFLLSLPLLALAGFIGFYAYRHSVAPLLRLARAADRIAAGERGPVPCVDRRDVIGDVARVLSGWQAATEERDVVIERAPVGICQTDRNGLLTQANLAAQAMLGYRRDQLIGHDIIEFLHESELGVAAYHRREARAGRRERTTFEGRFVRADGGQLWCSVTTGPIDVRDGVPTQHILILEDVTDRHLQTERAAMIQRQLLPRHAPALSGYQLAGACLPALDVAGDLYDWVLTERGELDLTVADVMGKGMPAALVMARLRTALRSAPSGSGPAARVAAGDAAVTFHMDGVEPFVTMFQCRLEPATGVLRYVDAGHGYGLVARADGTLSRLPGTSLPLGLGLGVVFAEAVVRLRPGDTLLVHSDGLVEVGDRTREARELVDVLVGAADADEAVRTLVDGVAGRQTDDVTAVVLRRLGAGA